MHQSLTPAVTQSGSRGHGTPQEDHDGRAVVRALSRTDDADLREIVALVRAICGTELAALTVMEGPRCHLLACVGFEPVVVPASESFCCRMLGEHGIVVAEDTLLDERFAANPYIDGTSDRVRFYASAPIYTPDQKMVGRVCVYDRAPHQLNELQVQTLGTLAASITQVMELRLRQDRERDDLDRHDPTSDEALHTAAQISHDLRIPLTAVITSLDMLHELAAQDDDPVRARVLVSARRSARRMGVMIEGLLRLREAGRRTHLVPVDLNDLVQQLLADSSAVLGAAGATVEVGDLPVVSVDPDQIYSVLLNLLGNAVKFVRPGVPPEVRVDARRTQGHWRVSVTDNGIGVAPELRSRVFSMFSRLDSSIEGHGIGLATVARIVAAHDGTVGLDDPEDGEGHGTEVWFTLPDTPTGGAHVPDMQRH